MHYRENCFVSLVQDTFKQSICTLQLTGVKQLSTNQHRDNFSFPILRLIFCASLSIASGPPALPFNLPSILSTIAGIRAFLHCITFLENSLLYFLPLTLHLFNTYWHLMFFLCWSLLNVVLLLRAMPVRWQQSRDFIWTKRSLSQLDEWRDLVGGGEAVIIQRRA